MKLIASWSGGKDSCFALHKALQQEHSTQALLTMMHDKTQSNFHLISSELLDAQAEALNLPITKILTKPETYERQFKKALKTAKENGAQGILTGDIYDVPQHQGGWLEKIAAEIGLKAIKPLWHKETNQIYKEFVNEGFRATVIRTKNDILSLDYLGRTLNRQFYNDLKKLGNVDPCGENGEYHTFVTDGPIFSKRIKIQQSKTSIINSWGRLEITKFTLTSKPKEKVDKP